jgi:protein-tyrosine phosphatase
MTSRAALRAYQHGKRVLITCHMGRNRSGLVMGLVLMQLGYTSAQAIALIRSARKGALSNAHFRGVLHGCDTHLGRRDSMTAIS